MADHLTTPRSGGGKVAREIFISAVHYDGPLRSGTATVLDLAPVAAAVGAQGVEYRDVYWRDTPAELPAVTRQLAQLRLKSAYTTVTPLYHRDPLRQQQLLRDIGDARIENEEALAAAGHP